MNKQNELRLILLPHISTRKVTFYQCLIESRPKQKTSYLVILTEKCYFQ